ncbi:MAG: SCO family protein [Nitrospinae bacterium]|nr:SCO family protein [Nitrospinota bacterium]
MARRMILVLTLGVLVGLAGAPAWRWLERSLFESLPVYSQLPDFALVDASGRAFARERLKGKVWVADFIYTRCEDTCPLQTSEMRRLQRAFAAHEDFRQISITTDPKHDEGALLSAYARKFGADRARWFFLTGKEKEIKDLALKGFRLSYATRQAMLPSDTAYERAFRVLLPSAHAHHPGHEDGADKPGIQISHSSRFVLIDRNFTIRGYYHSNDAESLEKLRKDLRFLLNS